MKDEILKYISPIEIHKNIKTKIYTKKIYDYEKEYNLIKNKDIIRENYYYDDETDLIVRFKVIEIKEEIELFFKYYKVENHDFHIPIKKENIDNTLPLINLNDFETFGSEIINLLSMQFCTKVFNLFQDNKLIIKD